MSCFVCRLLLPATRASRLFAWTGGTREGGGPGLGRLYGPAVAPPGGSRLRAGCGFVGRGRWFWYILSGDDKLHGGSALPEPLSGAFGTEGRLGLSMVGVLCRHDLCAGSRPVPIGDLWRNRHAHPAWRGGRRLLA